MTEHVNKFGRRQTRGVRPWLLMPKVFALAVLIGGLCSAAVLIHLASSRDMPQAEAVQLARHTRIIFRFVIVPAALCTVLFGVLLLLQHPKVFLSRRWLQVKLIALLIVVPVSHYLGRGSLHQAFALIEQGLSPVPMLQRLAIVIDVSIAALLVVYILGRQKPRLGQPIRNRRK